MPPVQYHTGRFPPKTLDLARLFPLIGPASTAIARYEGLLAAIPNAQVLLAPLSTQEAVLSSKIEGTQVTMGDVLRHEAGAGPESAERKSDIREVLNHRAALREATKLMKTVPLSQRVIRKAHEVLMHGVRGHEKSPGEYRKFPVCIGAKGCTAEQARFIPISAANLDDAMSCLERFIHEPAADVLVQLALLHVEFESIHPFLDGNGRIGRLLVPLFLVEKKLLSTPSFYVSAFLEAHREEYYERLLAVSRDDAWTEWCLFFLKALTEQARSNEAKARRILALYSQKKGWMADLTHSHHAIRALDWFFSTPIFRTPDFIRHSKIPKPTASRIVRLATRHRMLRVIRAAKGRTPAILDFPELLDIVEGNDGA